MISLSECRLYAFVDLAYTRGRPVEHVTRQLCEGGADLVQLRAKTCSVQEVRQFAEAMLPITREYRAGLVINDYPELAAELGADFCHLGQEDFFGRGWTDVSAVTNGSLGIGLSSHAPEQADRAVRAGADYIAVGPVFPTATKPAAKAATLDYVRWAGENVTIPWFAIGGITLENVDTVIAAGARRVCVVSAILNAPDISRACQEFKKRLTSAPAT